MLHLEDVKKKTELKHVASHLQSELKRRFRKCTDPGGFDFDPVFLMSIGSSLQCPSEQLAVGTHQNTSITTLKGYEWWCIQP